MTDQLPAEFAFVSIPDNCNEVDVVTLSCDIDPLDLQVDDEPVVLTVTVQAAADAPSGTYTNLAFVDAPEDPMSEPTCLTDSNNVACETTEVRREASITVEKLASVEQVSPGESFSYTMTVANPGPSTFLANLTLTDDLPDGLTLNSVTPGAEWTCNAVDPLVCTFAANVQPGVTTPAVTIGVTLAADFPGSLVINEATAIAIVDPPAAPEEAAIRAEATTSDPGTVVTATDDATTPVVRNADVAIDKSVSQTDGCGRCPVQLDPRHHQQRTERRDRRGRQRHDPGAVRSAGACSRRQDSAAPTCRTSVQCTPPSLAVGGSLHVVVQVRVATGAAAGTVVNTATVSTTSTDTNQANNTDSASIDITGSQSLPPTPPEVGSGAPTPQLPRTGNSSLGGPLTLASLLVVGGMFSLVIGRRRRAAAAQ